MLSCGHTPGSCLPARDSAGFTLIELVVTLVLVAIVMAVTSQILMQSLQASDNSVATATALRNVARTQEYLGGDIRSAISPDRADGYVSHPDSLREYLIGDIAFADFDLRDVAAATPTSLWLRADAVPEARGETPRTECVGYFVAGGGAFVREVYADWRNCPGTGTPVARTKLLDAPPNAPTAPPVFSYQLTHNSRPDKSPVDPRDCITYTSSAPTGRELNWIIRADVDLRSYVAFGLGRGGTKLHNSYDLRLRLARVYQYGLGCE